MLLLAAIDGRCRSFVKHFVMCYSLPLPVMMASFLQTKGTQGSVRRPKVARGSDVFVYGPYGHATKWHDRGPLQVCKYIPWYVVDTGIDRVVRPVFRGGW